MKILKIEFWQQQSTPYPHMTSVTVKHDTTPVEAAEIKMQVEAMWPNRVTIVFEKERGPKRLT